MSTTTPRLGVTIHRSVSPPDVVALARHADEAGLDDVWVIEDSFFTSGPPLAAAILTATERIHVGIGILPAVTRTAALAAMEAATLAAMGPGRVTIGIGHGVRHGVVLDDVTLAQPPTSVPPMLAGVRGPRSLAAMGAVADGILLADPAAPDYVRWARARAGGSAGVAASTKRHPRTMPGPGHHGPRRPADVGGTAILGHRQAQKTLYPPSMVTTSPVMNDDASLAR